MPFDLPKNVGPLQLLDAVVLVYVAVQALRGATQGPLPPLSSAVSLVAGLAVALAVGLADLPLPFANSFPEARVVLTLLVFLLAQMLVGQFLSLAMTPLAVSLSVVPGGGPLQTAAGLVAGAIYGALTVALLLSAVLTYVTQWPIQPWLEGSVLARPLADAGARGLAALTELTAALVARAQGVAR